MEKKNTGLVVLVIILSLLVLGLGGYIVYDKVLKNKDFINKEINNKISSIKIDNSLDYVYDADYSYDNKYKEFDRNFAGEESGKKTIDYYGIYVEYNMGKQYLSDLKVPYININSEAAKKVNDKMKNLYFDSAKDFDTCAEESFKGIEYGPSCSQILTYRTYEYEDILSVVVISSIQATSTWLLNYNVFNFDLNSGNLIDYKDTLSKIGYDYDETNSKLKVLLKNKMDELFSEHLDLSTACINNSNCYDKAYDILENDVENESIYYFMDNNGKLNVLVNTYCDAVENGTVNLYLVTVEK